MSQQDQDRGLPGGQERSRRARPDPADSGRRCTGAVESGRRWFRRHPTVTDACWVLPLMLLTGADLARSGSGLTSDGR